jgi:hypothetical protein
MFILILHYPSAIVYYIIEMEAKQCEVNILIATLGRQA